MSLILPANSLTGGYEIDNSLRFNSGSSDYLNRTPASAGNRQKFTYSFWVKRAKLSTSQYFLAIDTGATANFFYFNTSDRLVLYCYSSSGGVTDFYLEPNQLFRDVSAWYHIMLSVDTTSATADNRGRLYVNGSEVTSMLYRTNPTQNFNCLVNNTNQHNIGGTSYLDGYLSEVYLIDGQQLTPTDFGEFDEDTGIWKPIKYTGTYGTNGFYLDFENSGSLGADQSGNGNNFTVNNLTSVDQTTDTPTNNFATINALENSYSSFTLTEGNLKWVSTGASYSFLRSTIGVSQGKWYYEAKCTAQTNTQNKWIFGISDSPSTSSTNYIGANSYQYGWRGNSNEIFYNGTSTTYGSANSMTTGDIIGVAVDLDNNKIYWSKNGTFLNSANPATNTNGFSITGASSTNTGFYHFAFGELEGTYDYTSEINFGNPNYSANGYTDGAGFGNFSYQPPANYFSLCTKNLATYG